MDKDIFFNINLIYEIADGEADKKTTDAFLSHIEGCENCRRIYEEAVKIRYVMREDISPPSDFTEKTLQRIRAAKKPVIVRIFNHTAFKSAFAVAACLLVAVFVFRFDLFDKLENINNESGMDIYQVEENPNTSNIAAKDERNGDATKDTPIEITDNSIQIAENQAESEMEDDSFILFEAATVEEESIEEAFEEEVIEEEVEELFDEEIFEELEESLAEDVIEKIEEALEEETEESIPSKEVLEPEPEPEPEPEKTTASGGVELENDESSYEVAESPALTTAPSYFFYLSPPTSTSSDSELYAEIIEISNILTQNGAADGKYQTILLIPFSPDEDIDWTGINEQYNGEFILINSGFYGEYFYLAHEYNVKEYDLALLLFSQTACAISTENTDYSTTYLILSQTKK